ncbi:MAG: hypothetical protein U0183_00760 [Polyangiaceae bacterium]
MTRLVALDLPPLSPEAAVRVVRALGANRYVKERHHLVHAFVLAACEPVEPLVEACAWARAVLGDPTIDRDSKDPRLVREVTDKELCAALAAFWDEEALAGRTKAPGKLAALLGSIGIEPTGAALFDESAEDDMYPVLVDAGWSLLQIRELDPERHKGLVESYERIELESEIFEENAAIPPREYVIELPLLGAEELLRPVDEWGDFRDPWVVWSSLPGAYDDYLFRGVLKAAKVTADGLP